MPLVPLFDEFGPPANSHNVRSPGGFETWRIRAYDTKQRLLLFASLWNGYLFHPTYQRRYRAYGRHPTRNQPPLPRDFACQELAIYHDGRRISTTINSIPAIDSFPALHPTGLHFSLGSCQLHLRPLHQIQGFDLITLTTSHHWLFNNPLARITGKIQFDSSEFAIDALAVHEQRFGPSPINSKHWIEGCVFFASSAICFAANYTTSWMIHLKPDGAPLIDQPLEADAAPRSSMDIPCPRTMLLGDCATLTNPRTVHSSSYRHIRLYDAKATANSESGIAVVEFSRPGTLSDLLTNLQLPRPRPGVPITWSPIPPADKSSPSVPEHARGPSSSP